MKKIEKIISRDISILGMYADHIGLTDGLKEWFVWSYSDLIFYFHDNYADLMLASREHYQDFLGHAIEKIKKDASWFKNEQKKFLVLTKQFYDFFDESKNRLGKDISHSDIIQIYENFYDWMKRYYGLFVLMKWFPIWLENDFVLREKYNQEINLAINARKKAELILPGGRELTGLLLEKIKEEITFDKSLVQFFTKQEFFDFLKTSVLPSLDTLRQREKGFIFSREGIALTYGKPTEAKKILSGLGYEYEIGYYDGLKEFKGQAACAGVVTGVVRLIMVKSKIGDVKEGEILVTSMTTPEYLPAMKKAAAFVTDEGGITSHAAIVAREMKKPCVIGTKIATKALKDGMMVEVDADKGVVRIIK